MDAQADQHLVTIWLTIHVEQYTIKHLTNTNLFSISPADKDK